MTNNFSRFMSVMLCLLASANAVAADPFQNPPQVFLTMPFSEGRHAGAVAFQVRLGYSGRQGGASLAEFSMSKRGIAALKLGGVPLWSSLNPYLNEDAEPGAPAEAATGSSISLKTIGWSALGIAALAAVLAGGHSGGTGGDPSNPGSSTDAMNVCAVNGEGGGVGSQVPDACVPVGGG